MKLRSDNILTRFTKQWQLLLYLEIALIAVSFGILVYLFLDHIISSIIAFLVALTIGFSYKKTLDNYP